MTQAMDIDALIPTIRCGACGEVSPMDEWCRTPINGELPAGTYQCPRCQFAIRKRAPSEGTWVR